MPLELYSDAREIEMAAEWLAAHGECGEHEKAAWEVLFFCRYADIAARIQTRVLNSTGHFTKAIDRYSDRLIHSSVPLAQVLSKEVSRHDRRRIQQPQEAGGVAPDSRAAAR